MTETKAKPKTTRKRAAPKAAAKATVPFEYELKLEEHLSFFIANKTAEGFSPSQILEDYKIIKATITPDNIDLVLNEAKLKSICFHNRARLGYEKNNILEVTKRVIEEAKTKL